MAVEGGQQYLQAYTDYEALFSRGFKVIRQITMSCSQLINGGLGEDQQKAVQNILDATQSTIWPLDRVRKLFVEGENDETGGKRRKTVSLQQLVAQMEHEGDLLQKFQDEMKKGSWMAVLTPKMSERAKRSKVDALMEELQLSLRRVKSFAQAFVLEHGLKMTDLDKSKKTDAHSYQLYCEEAPVAAKAAPGGGRSCTSCRTKLMADANFCHHCGVKAAAGGGR